MMKSPYTALVSATPLNRVALAKLPGLLEHLGPIKAPSIRVASRAANALKAGYPVRGWDEVKDCGVLVVSASSEKVSTLLNEMVSSLEQWKRRLVIVVCAGVDNQDLAPLGRRGARFASIHFLGDPVDPMILVEGDAPAVRVTRRMLGPGTNKLFIVRKGSLALPRLTADQLQLALPPLLDAVQSALHHAGLNPAQCWRVVDTLVAHTMRSFHKSGRRAWKEPRPGPQRHSVLERLQLFEIANPASALFLRRVMAASIQRFSRNPSWIEGVL
jgi:hypothetical protein